MKVCIGKWRITTHIVIMSVCFTWVEQVDEAYSEKLTHRKCMCSENAREGMAAAIIDELYNISVTGLCSFYNVTLACTLSYHRSCVKLTEKGNMLTYCYIFLFNVIIFIIFIIITINIYIYITFIPRNLCNL